MSQKGYDAFFKAAQEAKIDKAKSEARGKRVDPQERAGSEKKGLDAYTEEELRKIFQMGSSDQKMNQRKRVKKKKRHYETPVLGLAGVCLLMALVSLMFIFPDEVEQLWSRISIKAIAIATAEDSENSSTAKSGAKEENSPSSKVEQAGAGEVGGERVSEEASYFKKLTERKEQLDLREKELNQLEEELHKQKAEIEGRIQRLSEIRREIAGVLQDRVSIDESKVNKLVEFYSNMKPAQAAEIISTIDEDLAVDVMGRMKKKNAAEIMNLLEPKKARALSEKFAGYKRR